jgi:metal-responsive CopG/Arc/MetJ family transcriptional regulator
VEQGYTVGITKGINMTIVKTAISIQKSLFQRAEEIAKEMKISRSRLFVLAVEDFIRRHQNKLLLEEINLAYADDPDENEQDELRRIQRKSIKSMAGNEW